MKLLHLALQRSIRPTRATKSRSATTTSTKMRSNFASVAISKKRSTAKIAATSATINSIVKERELASRLHDILRRPEGAGNAQSFRRRRPTLSPSPSKSPYLESIASLLLDLIVSTSYRPHVQAVEIDVAKQALILPDESISDFCHFEGPAKEDEEHDDNYHPGLNWRLKRGDVRNCYDERVEHNKEKDTIKRKVE